MQLQLELLLSPPSAMNKITRQKLSKAEENWNSIIYQLVLIDNLKALYATTVKYTLFSNAHGVIMKKSHMLVYETNLNKIEIIIIQITYYDPSGIKLESAIIRYHEKYQNS